MYRHPDFDNSFRVKPLGIILYRNKVAIFVTGLNPSFLV